MRLILLPLCALFFFILASCARPTGDLSSEVQQTGEVISVATRDLIWPEKWHHKKYGWESLSRVVRIHRRDQLDVVFRFKKEDATGRNIDIACAIAIQTRRDGGDTETRFEATVSKDRTGGGCHAGPQNQSNVDVTIAGYNAEAVEVGEDLGLDVSIVLKIGSKVIRSSKFVPYREEFV